MTAINSHPLSILKSWQARRDQHQWVLATLFRVEGSSYRKPGAFMLFNDLGQQLGMLSGGCLEADLQIQAQKVLQSGRPVLARYDTLNDDGKQAFPSLGCGGIVDIVLQPIRADNNYLQLNDILERLESNQPAACSMTITALPNNQAQCDNRLLASSDAIKHLLAKPFCTAYAIEEDQETTRLTACWHPPPNLLIAGGGADAAPVATLAAQLGWRVSVTDPRPANARPERFSTACRLDRTLLKTDTARSTAAGTTPTWLQHIDAAIIMSHNLNLDANAIRLLSGSSLRYCALLGPEHRKQQVLELANIDTDSFPCPIHGPAGIAIGGELAESIALSILAQCHQTLFCNDSGI